MTGASSCSPPPTLPPPAAAALRQAEMCVTKPINPKTSHHMTYLDKWTVSASTICMSWCCGLCYLVQRETYRTQKLLRVNHTHCLQQDCSHQIHGPKCHLVPCAIQGCTRRILLRNHKSHGILNRSTAAQQPSISLPFYRACLPESNSVY